MDVRIEEIRRNELPLAYRRVFRATVRFRANHALEAATPIEFAVESDALGQSHIHVEWLEHPDYPVVPLLRVLRQRIAELDAAGQLP